MSAAMTAWQHDISYLMLPVQPCQMLSIALDLAVHSSFEQPLPSLREPAAIAYAEVTFD